MHKLISFVIGGLLGLGLALTVNTVHDVTVDQSATIAAQAERIDKLEDGIERHLCSLPRSVTIHHRPTLPHDVRLGRL